MDILGYKQHPILQMFENAVLEKEYTLFIEEETKVFIRIGIILSIVSWISHSVFTFLYARHVFSFLASITLSSTVPFFLFIVYATHQDRFLGHYQWMSAVANGIAV
jgi:hypothetical protein